MECKRQLTATAVRLLFHRIMADQAFPLELKVANAGTRAAMVEAEKIIRSGKGSVRQFRRIIRQPGWLKRPSVRGSKD